MAVAPGQEVEQLVVGLGFVRLVAGGILELERNLEIWLVGEIRRLVHDCFD